MLCAGCSPKKESPPPAPAPPAAQTVEAPPEPVAAAVMRRPFVKPPSTELCEDCHPDEADGYAATGMGRALYAPEKAKVIENFDPKAATVKHPRTGVIYRAYIDEAGRWWQEERVEGGDYVQKVPVKYIVGSGNHTRSYLAEREAGELTELPLTWYVARGIWDMSPGYDSRNHFRFDRPINPRCIFCHNSLSEHIDDTISGYKRFAEGIGCERCHGDGAEHARARQAGQTPKKALDVINPAKLDHSAQLRVCQQCHLTGLARVLLEGERWDTYDPRTPLEDYMSIYVYERDGGPDFGISSHGDRLVLSACFKKSGALTCTKCHDPHKRDDGRSARAACLGCHQVEQCGDAHGAAKGSCAKCHMHRGETSDIPHVTFTDHFIRKKPRQGEKAKPTSVKIVDALAPTRTRKESEGRIAAREAVAHAQTWRFMGKEAHRQEALQQMMRASRLEPDYVELWVELGKLLLANHDYPGARAALQELERLAPEQALWRVDYAQALESTGEIAKAEAVLRRALELKPDYRVAWGNLANVLQRGGRREEAEAAYAKAHALWPTASNLANRGYNLLGQQKLEAARRWFEEALKLDGTVPGGPFNMATLALKQNDAKTARVWLNKALKLDPNHDKSHWVLGRMLFQEGDQQGARLHFESAIRANPRNPLVYVDLARLELKEGKRQAAQEALMRGSMAAPGTPLLKTLLHKVMAGQGI